MEEIGDGFKEERECLINNLLNLRSIGFDYPAVVESGLLDGLLFGRVIHMDQAKPRDISFRPLEIIHQ